MKAQNESNQNLLETIAKIPATGAWQRGVNLYALELVEQAETPADIARIERSMDRLWDVGAFRSGEAMRLHAEIMDKACQVERSGA